jgi:hypothetical protein
MTQVSDVVHRPLVFCFMSIPVETSSGLRWGVTNLALCIELTARTVIRDWSAYCVTCDVIQKDNT